MRSVSYPFTGIDFSGWLHSNQFCASPPTTHDTDLAVKNGVEDAAIPDDTSATQTLVKNDVDNGAGNDTEKAFNLLAALYALAGGWSEPKVPAGAPLSGTK